MSLDSCYAIIGCLLGAIVCLFGTLYSVCSKLKEIKSEKDFYEKYYYEKLNDIKNYKDQLFDLSKKIDEYDKIFENIKSLMPF